jgi:MFS family permease
MSLFAIGGIISSLLQAKYLSDIGKRTAIKYNSYILSLSMLIFTIAFTLSNKTSYVLANCVARLLQGVGVGGLSTVIYSYAPFIFNDR